jgi:hypothetical protein
MKKFLVLYLAPAAGLEEWMKQDPTVRELEEKKMKEAWDAWMAEHDSILKETAGAGSTKRVTSSGATDVKNDVMLFSIAEAESQEEVAKAFEGHPHFGIPGATIDIMPANYLLRETEE